MITSLKTEPFLKKKTSNIYLKKVWVTKSLKVCLCLLYIEIIPEYTRLAVLSSRPLKWAKGKKMISLFLYDIQHFICPSIWIPTSRRCNHAFHNYICYNSWRHAPCQRCDSFDRLAKQKLSSYKVDNFPLHKYYTYLL